MSLLAPLAIACFLPHDPLLLQARFPWVTLVPLLIGAQHGALAAAVSSALLAGLGALHIEVQNLELQAQGSYAELGAFVAGCFAAGTIAGASRDRIQAQLSRLTARADEDARRLSRLGRTHAVLRLSHRKLEERLAARSWSLASAFEDARRALGNASSPEAVGDVVLGVLSNHALVQSATLLTFTAEPAANADAEPHQLGVSATLGSAPAVDLQHRLLRRALETRRLVALDADSADGSDETLLAVAPLCATSGRLLGLVLVHELPFMAFQTEGLNGLAALTALLADMLEDQFVDAHNGAALEALFTPALTPLAPPTLAADPERGLRAVPALDEPVELGPEAADDDPLESGVVRSRSGSDRRRGVAQSA